MLLQVMMLSEITVGLLSAGLKVTRQDDYGIDAVERALGKSNVTIGENLTEWFNILATTGATAPFVGLVGTIFGIINAFSMIGADGGADLTTLAPAIGEALITTAFGIIVALVGVWLFNYFTAKVETVTNEVTRSAQDLIDWCHKQVSPFDQGCCKMVLIFTVTSLMAYVLMLRSESDFIVLKPNNKKWSIHYGHEYGRKERRSHGGY